MRHLAIGDIHGCFRALTALAEFVPFGADDVVVTLGDYVDRGPDSRAVLEWLTAYSARAILVALRGNHDVMMLRARSDRKYLEWWYDMGGEATLWSYSNGARPAALADVPDAHWNFLERTRPFHEIDTHFFVHANAFPNCALEDQTDAMLYWEFIDNPQPHESGKVMICGHTAQRSGEPLDLGHTVCIDTFACGAGWLTCLDVAIGQCWQANERGETRTRRLSP